MRKQLKHLQRVALVFTGYILFTALFPHSVIAQYTLDEKVSFVYINGTSTLHDWTAFVEQMKGSLQAEVEANHIVKINSVKISIPTTSLKSEKEAMDKNMYKALKSDSYPEITYQLKSNVIHNGTITTKGELTIAGVAKNIETKVTQKEAGKHIKIDGEVKLKMSDFNIKPPEFLFGAFKTGDEITITFHFMFCENN
jgi:polyisoprenoid-binding protein YceI